MKFTLQFVEQDLGEGWFHFQLTPTKLIKYARFELQTCCHHSKGARLAYKVLPAPLRKSPTACETTLTLLCGRNQRTTGEYAAEMREPRIWFETFQGGWLEIQMTLSTLYFGQMIDWFQGFGFQTTQYNPIPNSATTNTATATTFS